MYRGKREICEIGQVPRGRSSSWLPRMGSAAALVAVVLLALSALPAEADTKCSRHAEGSTVCLTSGHNWLRVCDLSKDGRLVSARTYRYGVVRPPLYDKNGARRGCSRYRARVGSLDAFNVCVQRESCGRPVYWPQF